jgi:hypothetical protein
LREHLLQLELLAMLPLMQLRDLQRHGVVPSLQHLVLPKLVRVSLALVQELELKQQAPQQLELVLKEQAPQQLELVQKPEWM